MPQNVAAWLPAVRYIGRHALILYAGAYVVLFRSHRSWSKISTHVHLAQSVHVVVGKALLCMHIFACYLYTFFLVSVLFGH